MSVEFLGFVAGIALVCGAVLALLRHERWKAIHSAYGPGRRGSRGGNALIWPSH